MAVVKEELEMRRHLTVVLLTLASMFLSSIVVTGCAYRRADRSLVQPLALSKKQFKGEWYYMKTVYEAPFESGFFNGQGGWPLVPRSVGRSQSVTCTHLTLPPTSVTLIAN